MAKKRRKIIKDLDHHRNRAKAVEAQEAVTGIGAYPLVAPGMPMPGPNFIEHARRLGDTSKELSEKVKDEKTGRNKTIKRIDPGEILEDLYKRALREPGFEIPVQTRGVTWKQVRFVPGHIWGQHADDYAGGGTKAVDGPRPADVMVIGKMPGAAEVQEGRNMIGPSGELLVNMLRDLKIKGVRKWYVTNLLKFNPPDGAAVKASWIKDCLPLLHQELRIVRPKVILCLGTDASKALLGTKYTVSYMEGRVLEHEFPVNTEGDEVLHKALVMTVVHPAAVARSPEMGRTLERGLARFNLLKNGNRWDKSEKDIDHRAIRSLSELKALLWEIEHDPQQKSNVMAVDAEWHGEHPVNKGTYVRTIQFAWREKRACAVVLRGPGGRITFRDDDGKPAIKRGIKLLSRFFKRKRVVGHFFNADLEWLVHIGLDLRKPFQSPLRGRRLSKFGKRLHRRYERLGFEGDEVVPAWRGRCGHRPDGPRHRRDGHAGLGKLGDALHDSASLRCAVARLASRVLQRARAEGQGLGGVR
jgi:uracil-DNA glycosylase family 4